MQSPVIEEVYSDSDFISTPKEEQFPQDSLFSRTQSTVIYDSNKAREPQGPQGPQEPREPQDPNGVGEEEINFEDIDLTDFYTDNLESEKGKECRKLIDTHRWFYLKNEKNDIIALRKKTVFVKFKSDKKFIGFKFQDCFKEEKNLCVLLTQTVNEREKMKSLGKVLFYRELYLSTRKNASVQKLFNHYIGGNEIKFSLLEKENVDYYRWSFLVHKNRFNYIVNLIKINHSRIDVEVKNIKNYDDIYNFVMNNL